MRPSRSSACGILAALAVGALLASCASERDGGRVAASDPCGPGADRIECFRSKEGKALRDDGDVVRRLGDRLVIESRRGGDVTFEDSAESDRDGAWYSYTGRLQGLGFYIVEVRYWEGGGFVLVDAVSGDQTPCAAIPVVSPSRLRVAATNVDLRAKLRPTAVQIWRVGDSGLVPEFRYNFIDSNWGPGRVHWIDDEKFRVPRIGADGREQGDEAFFELTAGGWRSDDLPVSSRR